MRLEIPPFPTDVVNGSDALPTFLVWSLAVALLSALFITMTIVALRADMRNRRREIEREQRALARRRVEVAGVEPGAERQVAREVARHLRERA